VRATAVLAALLAAIGFAVSSSLQHHETGRAPESVSGAARLLRHLLKRPRWLLGQVLAVCAFCLHAVALHAGPLTLVQPIMVSGVVYAVPIRAWMSRRRPARGEVVAVLTTAVGLGLLLVAAGDMAGSTTPSGAFPAVVTATGAAVAAGAYLLAGRARTAAGRAGWYGVAAGVLFGLVAALVKLSLSLVQSGVPNVLQLWPVPMVVILGLSGVATNQRAYRVGSLSASLAVLNSVNVLMALLLGIAMFHEIPDHSPVALVGEVVGLGCLIFGIARLSAWAEPEGSTTHERELVIR
jgi:drug/metabolite transporter (DMT)-like permease